MADDVIVKKISPYPIPTQVNASGQVLNGNIVKLTEIGFLMNMTSLVLLVGHEYEVTFVIPASRNQIIIMTKVIKTYDRKLNTTSVTGQNLDPGESPPQGDQEKVITAAQKARGLQTERLVEMHFLGLGDNQRQVIREFIIRIGQAK